MRTDRILMLLGLIGICTAALAADETPAQTSPIPPVAATESPLVGMTWRLEAYDQGQGTLVPPLKGTEITLSLTPDGRLGGSDGCNRYLSGYTLEGHALLVGPIATTRMACRGPESVARQAATYAALLGQARSYHIAADQLILKTEGGAPLASFRVVAGDDQAAPAPGT
jgi:heat shock protein HslJ